MLISFSPQRRDDTLTVGKSGDVLTINSETHDLSVIPDGATAPVGSITSEWIIGPVERIDGVLHVTLILPHGPNPSQAVAFPEPITVLSDGPVPVPQDEEPSHDD